MLMVARLVEVEGTEIEAGSEGSEPERGDLVGASGLAHMPMQRQGSCLKGVRFMLLRIKVTMLYQW